LGRILAWESHDPALFGVHFLTVACYNLQHPASYTDEAIAGLSETLKAVLDDGLGIAEVRRRTSDRYDGAQRVRRPEADRRPVRRDWEMTVADVYLPDRPEGATERVKTWAAAVRKAL
jgi:hypothetical protein